jgi:Phage-related minor tail protein
MAGNAGELYLEIRVDDDGSIKVKQFGNEMKKAGKDGEQAFDRLDRESRQLRGSMDGLRGAVGQVAAAFGAWQLGGFIKESAMAAARYETLGVVMAAVGENYGHSREELERYTEALQDGGIAMLESRGVLLKMIQAEMDLTKARELAQVAQAAAVIGNINSSQAFDQMVYGIQSAQIEVLRTIGINVNFEQSYKKAAKAMGKTVTSLTEQEKIQIRTNAVLQQGEKIAVAYGAAMSTAGKKIGSSTRYIDNFKKVVGDAFQPALTEAVDKATDALKRLTEEVSTPENQERLAGFADTAVTTAENLVSAGGAALKFTGKIADGWNALPEPIREYGLFALIGGKALGPQAAAAIVTIGAYIEAEKALTKAAQINTEDGLDWTEKFSLWIADLEHGTDVLGNYERQLADVAENSHIFRGAVTPPPDAAPSNKPTIVPDPEETTQDSDKVTKALHQVNDAIAKMTLTSMEYEKYAFDQKVADLAAVLGSANPKLREMVDAFDAIQEKKDEWVDFWDAVDEAAFDNDFDEFVTNFDKGFDDIEKKAKETQEKNLQVLTEFSREYQELVLGETEFKIAQIEEQARVWCEAGASSVQVAQWEKASKLQASREWHDGAIRAFQDYADSTSDMARGMASMVTNDLDSIRDTLVDLADTGKFKWQDMVNSMRHEMNKLVIDKAIMAPISSGMGSFVSSLFPNAHGDAYASPSLSRYSGRVVNRPTFFAFAHGAGVMGENRGKSEVIAPLFRDPVSNDMGVKAKVEVGESAPVYVTVDTKLELINQTGQAMSASTEPTSNGLRMILRAVGQSAATGGEVAKGIQAGFKVQKRVR